MRTFARDDWLRSQEEWTAGEFSDEWKPFRHRAAMRGMIFPPDGSRWDGWEDEHPSQRAMLIRAIRETPKLLGECIDRSRSWWEVIDKLTRARDDWRAEQDREERYQNGLRDDIDEREATVALKRILDRLADS